MSEKPQPIDLPRTGLLLGEMAYDEKPQEPKVPPTAITNPHLAEEMAYGEKPHRELANQAKELGLTEEADSQLNKAYGKGVEAGKKFLGEEQSAVDEQQTKLDSSKAQLEAGVGADVESSKENPGFASETVWSAMSPEQRKVATEVRGAMAKKLEEYGVTKESLRVVQTEGKDGMPTFTLLHTGAGVDIGDPKKANDEARSYTSVMSDENDELFKFESNGNSYDARAGMTDAAYRAKVEEARERGVTLPDSQELSKETGDYWTSTMLTGAPTLNGGNVPFRSVSGVRVGAGVYDPRRGFRAVRVCPAVVIE
ncbi:MAG: hypothetical protein M3P98_03550 [bacterium]|nr:hypothetical protein [bacterium]